MDFRISYFCIILNLEGYYCGAERGTDYISWDIEDEDSGAKDRPFLEVWKKLKHEILDSDTADFIEEIEDIEDLLEGTSPGGVVEVNHFASPECSQPMLGLQFSHSSLPLSLLAAWV